MIGRFPLILIFCLFLSSLSMAEELVISEATTLEEVIKKYSVASVLDTSETPEVSPLFMTWVERRLAFANFNLLYATRSIPVGGSALPMPHDLMDLTGISFVADEEINTVTSLLNNEQLMGLIVLQGGKIRLEHYAADHRIDTRWVTFSVTKSVTSMLVGAAIQEGYIESVEDPIVKYLPRLAGSAYGKSRVKDLLQMASGIAWNEDYEDPESDVARAAALNGIDLTRYLLELPRVAAAGMIFNYNTAETNLLGEVLRSAIGMNAAPYLSQKIWQPMGMKYEANWLLSQPLGRETGGCCISATLRDYARLGLFALADGVLPDGTRVLPEGWMAESISPSNGYEGYGYKWWLYGSERYAARGLYGQTIFVDPKADMVMAVHSNSRRPSNSAYHRKLENALLAISDYFRAQ